MRFRVSPDIISALPTAMADEDNYVDNFVAGDDGTLMAAIEQRKSQVQPLVRCVARTCSRFCLRDLFLPQRSLTRFALAGRRVAIRSRRCASHCPIHLTRRKLSPSRCAELLDRARALARDGRPMFPQANPAEAA